LLDDPEDAVDDVLNGPVSREQPDVQPVAAGPANVGENCPKLDVVTALAGAPVALPVAAATTKKAPSSITGSDSSVTRIPLRLLRMRLSLPRSSPRSPLNMSV
jgi:hypothetical protein